MQPSEASPLKAAHLMRPAEQGMVEGFDRLFQALEKTVKAKLATQIRNKQEFLTKTFPGWITMGAEHPQLSGGVLYILGLVTPHTHGGSEAINSIPRRYAEQKYTKPVKDTASSLLQAIHKHNEAAIYYGSGKPINQIGITDLSRQGTSDKKLTDAQAHETTKIVNTELERARLTRELYQLRENFVEVKYQKDDKQINLGRVGSQYSILNTDSKTGNTMVFFCDTGGNPTGCESFLVQYALATGDRVIAIGQPDAAGGTMSKEFANAAFVDAHPPSLDLYRKFHAPTYEPHAQFFQKSVHKLLRSDAYDLYARSGGAIFAKKCLEDPKFAKNVNNVVFLNPAGTTNFFTRVPGAFRTTIGLQEAVLGIGEGKDLVRYQFDKDKEESAKTPTNRFRDRVTVAIQDGSHYKQPGWDSVSMPKGKVIFALGGRDRATDGKKFAKSLLARQKNPDSSLPTNYAIDYDPKATHMTTFTKPEPLIKRLFSHHFPDRSLLA